MTIYRYARVCVYGCIFAAHNDAKPAKSQVRCNAEWSWATHSRPVIWISAQLHCRPSFLLDLSMIFPLPLMLCIYSIAVTNSGLFLQLSFCPLFRWPWPVPWSHFHFWPVDFCPPVVPSAMPLVFPHQHSQVLDSQLVSLPSSNRSENELKTLVTLERPGTFFLSLSKIAWTWAVRGAIQYPFGLTI